jgi:nuclear pore complex protein Nup62
MDEIITRWAADLSKYQKEFQSQAEQVARWDQAIVQNANKINQLYSKTFQADRDATEVERQLRIMEENQDELESYLDKYEREVEEMMKAKGLAGQEGARGPDQERERTYKLAEKLQDRLNDLNKDLTEMIEEINTTSQALSKTGKPDDPVSPFYLLMCTLFMLT